MPHVSFSFKGWVSGASVDKATDTQTLEDVDVSGLTDDEFVQQLNDGKLLLSLDDCLSDCKKSEVEIFDYESY